MPALPTITQIIPRQADLTDSAVTKPTTRPGDEEETTTTKKQTTTTDDDEEDTTKTSTKNRAVVAADTETDTKSDTKTKTDTDTKTTDTAITSTVGYVEGAQQWKAKCSAEGYTSAGCLEETGKLSKEQTGLVIGAVLAVFVLGALIFSFIRWRIRRKKEKEDHKNEMEKLRYGNGRPPLP